MKTISAPVRPRSPSLALRQLAKRLKLVAHPIRLGMLLLIDEAPLTHTIWTLCEATGSPTKFAASFQMAILKQAGMIETRRRASHVVYRLTDQGREMVFLARPFTRPVPSPLQSEPPPPQ